MNTFNNDSTEVTKKDRMLLLTILVIVLIVAAMAICGFLFIKQGPDTVQGQGDASEVRISGKMPGRVADLYVEEGHYVKAGDTLAHIHSNLVEARMNQAKAMENVAAATNRKVDAGTRTQIISAAHDLWTQAQAASGITEKTWRRMENLFAKGVISEQKRDEAKAAYDAAKAAESAAKSQYELAKSGAQSEDKEAAQAMVNAARGSVEEVNAILEDQYLVAPCDGLVVTVFPQVSELVATGAPIMTIQKSDHWATFNVRENLLKEIKLGKEIKVYIPALDLHTTMKVFYVKDMGTYANWQATKSTGDYDARTFQVKARPDKPIENFMPGMSVIYEGVK